MKKNKILLLALSILAIFAFSGCQNISSIINGGGDRPHTTITSTSGTKKTNEIEFNVATVQKLSDVKAAKEQAEYEEYTNLKLVLKRIRKSVVDINVTLENSQVSAYGVVVGTNIVSSDGENDSTSSSQAPKTDLEVKSYIVTCHHLVGSAKEIKIKTADGEEYLASFIGSDPSSDVCVLSVNAELSPVEAHADTDTLEIGESVVAIGNPLSTADGSVTSGILSAVPSDIDIGGDLIKLLQTDSAVNSGNTGGALFTSTGFFIGLVNNKYQENFSEIQGLGFAVPANELLDTTKKLVETSTDETPGYIPGKYKLGYTAIDEYGNLWGTQIYVTIETLDEEGCFFKSNLKVGDIIKTVTYKGETFVPTRSEDFSQYLNSINFEIGDELTFAVTRDKTSITVPVTIRQYIYGE